LAFVVIGIAFVIFIILNGGIVVGDRENHVATFHAPQVLYFATSSVLFMGLASIQWSRLRRTIRACMTPFQSATGFLALASVVTLLLVVVSKFTYAHPFILADNRHYTFYLWRHVFARHQLVKFLLIPVYLISFAILSDSLCKLDGRMSNFNWSLLSASKSLLWQTIFLLATAAVLVPTPLVEFRYYVIPILVAQLHDDSLTDVSLAMNCVANLVVNSVLGYVFLYRPYEWNDGSTARFMW
jgi:alpha-1,2-glucosyltransferase